MIYKIRDEKGYCLEIEVVDNIVCVLVFEEDNIQQGGLVKIDISEWNKMMNAMEQNCETINLKEFKQ